MRIRFFAIFTFLVLAAQGQASANASCSASDENIDFNFEALSGRSLAGSPFDVKATAELLDSNVPEDFRTLSLQNDRAQSWISGTDFNLHFHRQRPAGQPYAAMDLVIETTRDPKSVDPEFKGAYRLTLRAAPLGRDATPVEVDISGKATCYND